MSSALDEVLDSAVTAAPEYASTDDKQRAAFLGAIAHRLEANRDAIVATADRETHLGHPRLQGELDRAANQLRLFADLVVDGSWQDARIDTGPPDIRRTLIPLGPVAVFGASNFPLAFSVPGGDTASALAAGCPVICKAHPAHPATSKLAAAAIERALVETGLPNGVFALLTDTTVTAGQELVADDRIEAVAFTGSFTAGKAIYDIAARRHRPIPVYAEMGSTNPVFVLPDAAAQRGQQIASDLADSITLGVGQFCTKPGIVVAIDGTIGDALTEAMADRAAATMLTPNIADHYVRGVNAMLEAGASLAAGTPGRGQPVLARVDAATFIEHPELAHEVFGPASLLVEAKTAPALLAVANSFHGQLTATLYASDDELAANSDLVTALSRHVGRLVANDVPTGVTVNHAMHHGGPYPASTDPKATSVGTAAIERFVRPICYQNFPDAALPPLLRDLNPLNAIRLLNGHLTPDPIQR